MSSTYHTYNNADNNWYDLCKCCPYGYHIDLDFARYCELVSQEANRTGSNKRRRDRGRRCQSREVLLGIMTPQMLNEILPIEEHPKAPKIVQKIQYPLKQDGFDDAVSDFEKILKRFNNKQSNLPDVTAVNEQPIKRISSNSSISSHSGSMTVLPEINRDFDTVSVESYGFSAPALQNIREQMAISLERTKELEEMVKQIPALKKELVLIKDENKRLHLEVKHEKDSKLSTINTNYLYKFQNNRLKSQSFTNIDSLDGGNRQKPKKDIGINCTVITRNIGVGNQTPSTKSVSTITNNDSYADKWFNEKVRFLNDLNSPTKTTQTHREQQKEVSSQTIAPIEKVERSTQTFVNQKTYRSIAVAANPITHDFQGQKTVEVYNIGCSDDTIDDVYCPKCLVPKCSTGVGPDSSEDACTSISLSALMGPRSKSFNLGEDRTNLGRTRHRTVGVQCEANCATKACQSGVKTQSKGCQRDVLQISKSIQVEVARMDRVETASIRTDTKDLVKLVSVGCEAVGVGIGEMKETVEVGCNTQFNVESSCAKCVGKDKGRITIKDETQTPSRIPRPQIPTTPVEARKFKRQDTYTKISNSLSTENISTSSIRLSGLDLTSKVESSSSPLDKVKQNLKLPEATSVVSTENGENTTKVKIQETTLPEPEPAFNPFHAPTHRKKAMPSKEMQGALKVLNDSLQKHTSKQLKNTTAINIIQKEWFKISSLVTANPLDVEDYLDMFEDFSSILLQYIVNMSDDSGNTAMHYAVSLGNFDVVSILLDSKVCDINKPNKAGYTSVMLVSLAEIKSQTHANVVRRLFQLSDVNIRATQHGQTALMLAVSHGRLDMVKMLLEAGADINIQDDDGSTALMCAAEHGHTEIVGLFLTQSDCDSMIQDIDGSTALKIAMEADYRHIGMLLYAHQRMQNAKNKKSKPASPRTPSSPLPIRSSHRALTDTKK